MEEDEDRGRWPRQLTIRVIQVVYLAITESSLGWVTRLSLVQRIKYRFIRTPAWRVLAVLDLLAAAEVRAWVAGGWGVDALLGRQTRPHCDIDLVVGDDDPSCQQVAQVLAREGFRFTGAYHHPGIPIPWCHIWRHDAGAQGGGSAGPAARAAVRGRR